MFGRISDGTGGHGLNLEHYVSKLRTPLSIAFAFVATHNHFVLDRGGKVFNRSAPIIKLPADATEDDHLALLGLLNSSHGVLLDEAGLPQQGQYGGRAGRTPNHHCVRKLLSSSTGTGLQKFPVTEEKPLRPRHRPGSSGPGAAKAPARRNWLRSFPLSRAALDEHQDQADGPARAA